MSTSNCSDSLSNINLSVPMLPCSDLSNLEKWNQYCMDMNTLVSNPNFPRVMNQCVCQNGPECLKQKKCSDQISGNPTLILGDPTCCQCVLSQSCQQFEPDLNKFGCVMTNLFKSGPTITPDSLNETVSKCCGIVPVWNSSTIANVLEILNNGNPSSNSSSTHSSVTAAVKMLNDRKNNSNSDHSTDTDAVKTLKPPTSSESLFKKYLWIWIMIVIIAVVVLVGGLVLMTKRGHLSRDAKKL